MILTKSFYVNPTATYERGMESFDGLGYTLSIPWNDISTAGWSNMEKVSMKVWGNRK